MVMGLLLPACNQENPIKIRITHQKSGFGYQIMKQNEVLINQPFIPAVQGEMAFKDRLQALKTAQLVVQKIERKTFPKVSVHELDSMKIDYGTF